MASAPIESLDELLRALSRERSLRGRLRVIGQAWQLLRGLAPSEREQVALRMGSSWVWKRLEKSFLADGQLSETEQLVGRVLERMGDSDPGELRELAEMVRTRDREGLTDTLVIGLHEALQDEAEAEERALSTAAPDEGEPEPDAATPAGAIVDSATEVLASTLAREVAAAPAPQRPPTPARSEPAPRPEGDPAPAEPEAPRTAPAVQRLQPAAIEPRPSAPSELPDPLLLEAPVAASDGTARLRVLRALQRDPGRDLGRVGRARLVESLGGGWASRRALSRMIVTRSVDDVDEALALIERLARPGQRFWCLADVLAHWELDPDARSRVLAAAPTDAARRRLASRIAAAQ